MTIGILYICTGKYSIFWKDFFKSCEKNFITNATKKYFVFTDNEDPGFAEAPNVSVIYQQKLGWPYDTLKRFDIFLKCETDLLKTDYLFFFNANALIVNEITDEILPVNEGLVGVKHPCLYNSKPGEYIYDRNSESLAYVPLGEGKYYFMGSFNGGRTNEYLTMCRSLRNNIEADEKKQIIALWHDESHLNRYFMDHPVKVLSPEYAYPEEMQLPFTPRILLRDKNKYGGHNFLRAVSQSNGGLNRLLRKLSSIKKYFVS